MQKASKIEFQLTSTQGELFENESIILWMRLNGRTVNCAYNLTAFKDKKSIESSLNAFVNCALNELFPSKDNKCKKHKK